ncbi:helix-turn-helix transcriptional regulator [Nostocoides vanveenii]|uniref:WYL domain-containing protein n=1 Tax=Nostocoides vanveenii TaxID=330835 RepID=A0ABN2K1V4_9MICO
MIIAESASARVPRLLSLVPWLVNRQGVDIDQAARELGVSVAQLQADLDLLFMCGYGTMTDELIDVSTEGGKIFIRNAETIARPLRLSRAEALTLMVGLRALAGADGVTDAPVVERALAKLEAAAASIMGEGGRVEAVLDDASTADTRAVVADALKAHRRLHLRYHVPARDESTERDVDPMRLLGIEGHWYLEGWCHRASDTRLFRLDRITTIEILDADGTPPPDARTRDLSAGTFVASADHPVITLDLSTGWEWVAEYYPVESVDLPQEDGPATRRVTLRAGETGWVRRLALRSGGGVRVVAPPELAREVSEAAGRALAAYGHTQTPVGETGDGTAANEVHAR